MHFLPATALNDSKTPSDDSPEDGNTLSLHAGP